MRLARLSTLSMKSLLPSPWLLEAPSGRKLTEGGQVTLKQSMVGGH